MIKLKAIWLGAMLALASVAPARAGSWTKAGVGGRVEIFVTPNSSEGVDLYDRHRPSERQFLATVPRGQRVVLQLDDAWLEFVTSGSLRHSTSSDVAGGLDAHFVAIDPPRAPGEVWIELRHR